MFWENSDNHKGDEQRSKKRFTSIINLQNHVPPGDWDHADEAKYGKGTARPVEWFYKLFGIDTEASTSLDDRLCKFVKTGRMHRAFQPSLRPNGLGIDYSGLVDFDTRASINAELDEMRKPAVAQLERALDRANVQGLQTGLDMAKRSALSEVNPQLVSRAKAKLSELKG